MKHSGLDIVRADWSLPKHRDAVVELMDLFARDVQGRGVGLRDTVKRDLPDELLKRSACMVAVALVRGQPAGLSINFEVFSKFACLPILNIHDFVVAPQYRGQGIAEHLLQAVEALGKEWAVKSGLWKCSKEMSVLKRSISSLGLAATNSIQRWGGRCFTIKKFRHNL